jgi:serine protease Do
LNRREKDMEEQNMNQMPQNEGQRQEAGAQQPGAQPPQQGQPGAYPYQQPGASYSYQQPRYQQRPSYYTPYMGNQPTMPPMRRPKKHNGWKVAIALVCSFAFLISVIAGVKISALLLQKPGGSGNFVLPQASTNEENMGYLKSVQNSSYESVSDIAEDVGKSVVTIIISISYGSSFESYKAESLGSGVIIGEEGDKIYIATNYHVIAEASDVSIIAGSDDSTTIQAYYQGADADTDLAVIYIKKSDVPESIYDQIKIATLGDSSTMRLGDLAIAIGSPVDKRFGNSVTAGAISGLERSVTFVDEETNVSQTMTLMQTDAAINPGNSGGALVNGRGEVIGINNAKISSTEVEGMGFAIPSNIAKPVLEQLINYGKVSRPYIGITGTNVIGYQNFAAEYQIVSGVIVISVVDGGPAAIAGLQVYDVILTFNDKTIETFDDLTAAIQEVEIGDTATIEVLRGYQEDQPQTVSLTVKIAEKDSTGRK